MGKFGHGKNKQPIDLDGRGLESKPQEKNKQGGNHSGRVKLF